MMLLMQIQDYLAMAQANLLFVGLLIVNIITEVQGMSIIQFVIDY